MKKPNVIFAFSDQHRAQACGYAGDPDVITPHMDALADESISFTQAVSGMPVCCPYRASLMTGQYPHHHGVFLNDVCLNPNIVSIADVFRNNGYNTAYVGKWHLDGHGRSAYIPKERRHGFDYWKALECTHNYNQSFYYDNDASTKKQWNGYDAFAQTDDVIDYMKNRRGDKPFFLMLSWGAPHSPYNTAPQKYKDLYKFASMTHRENVPLESYMFYRDVSGYYAHITAIDDCIGKLVDAIDELNLRDDTVLIYTSDHGDMLGSQGALEKQSPWEESIRVPFLLRYPRIYGSTGRKLETPIGTPDIMPTLLDLCGIEYPGSVDGKSFRGYMDGEEPGDVPILLQCMQPNGTWHKNNGGREYRGIRTKQYTYAEDLHGPWLLFDNENDPLQMSNLVDKINNGEDVDGCLSALLQKMKDCLKEKLSEAGDEFLPGAHYLNQWGYKEKINFMNTYPFAW